MASVSWRRHVPRWQAIFEARLPPEMQELVAPHRIKVYVNRQRTRIPGEYQRLGSVHPVHRIGLSYFLRHDEAREVFGREYARFVVAVVYPDRSNRPDGERWRMVMGYLSLDLAMPDIPDLGERRRTHYQEGAGSPV